MNPLAVIILLTVLGVGLIAVDFFLPGFVLGSIGILLLLSAVAIEFWHGGAAKATGLFVLQAILGLIAGYITIYYGPRTAAGRKMILSHAQTDQRSAVSAATELVGVHGTAQTILRPSGLALLNGQRLDVVAESGMIERGSSICVVAVDGTRIIVKKV